MSVQELQETISKEFTDKTLEEIVFRKTGVRDAVIKSITMGEASKKGDSYLSNICRFTVTTGENGEISIPVIVKFLPKNLARRKTYRSLDFFENEYIFYTIVWPALQAFQHDTKIPEKFDSIPLLLAACADGENDFIALEDVSPQGYATLERGAGLDLIHTDAILNLLAQFHALSLAFKEKQPQKFEDAVTQLKETYFAEKFRSWYGNFQKRVFTVFRDAIQKELPEEYWGKFEKLVEGDLYGELVKACVVRGPLSVVSHGDVWLPNFLFKHDGGKPKDMKMIDFQLTRYTTLSGDLLFFLLACVDTSVIEAQWDHFIKHYHSSLVNAQKLYGCQNLVDFPTFEKELSKSYWFAVGMSMEALIMCQLEDHEVSDLDAIQGEEAVPLESVWTICPFNESERRKRLAGFIKFAADKKFI